MSSAAHDVQSEPATLASLPEPILYLIAGKLDRNSAISFAQVAKFCVSAARPHIWRTFSLLHPSDMIGPRPDRGLSSSDRDRALEAIQTCLRDKVTQALAHGDKRWPLVRTIELSSIQAIPIPQILTLLDKASGSLQKLAVYPWDGFMDFKPNRWPDTLDTAVLRDGPILRFSSLRHVHLGIQSMIDHRFIPYLLEAAPYMQALHFCLVDRRIIYPKVPIDVGSRLVKEDTKLHSLTISAYSSLGAHPPAFPMIKSLLAHSPALRKVSIRYSDCDEAIEAEMFTAVRKAESIEELEWDLSTSDYEAPVPAKHDYSTWSGIRRFAMNWYDWDPPVLVTGDMPDLETLYLGTGLRQAEYCTYTDFSKIANISADLPDFLGWLGDNPSLHRVYYLRGHLSSPDDEGWDKLNEAEISTTPSLVIRSYRHGRSELLHIRALLQDVESLGISTLVPPRYRSEGDGVITSETLTTKRILYTFEKYGNWYDRLAVRASPPEYYDYTDWNGVSVPMDVLGKMQAVQGLNEADCAKRAIELGDAAWKVLTDWKDGQGAE